MKFSRLLVLFFVLSAFVASPVLADDDEVVSSVRSPFTFMHHVDLPQPVLGPNDDIGLFAVGYHFTLFTFWNRVAIGGAGTGFGFMPPVTEDARWDSRFYVQIPIADISMLHGGYDGDGEVSFEFTTSVLRELRYGSWGGRALFSVGWQ